MPARPQSVAMTDAYRERLLVIRAATTRATRASFARLDQADLDASFAVWLSGAAAMLAASKRQGAALTQRYLAAYVASETGRTGPIPDINLDAYAETDRSGRPVAQSLIPPLYTVKARLGQGVDWRTALAAGAARMTRTVAGESMAAPRQALSDLMRREDRIVGWQRVASGNACGACLAAATGAIRRDSEVPEAHDACRCVAEPVVRGARETVRRQTGEEIFQGKSDAEQAALFHGRGGEEKAALIRNGDVPFDALLQHTHRATQADDITEAPLDALRAAAGQSEADFVRSRLAEPSLGRSERAAGERRLAQLERDPATPVWQPQN